MIKNIVKKLYVAGISALLTVVFLGALSPLTAHAVSTPVLVAHWNFDEKTAGANATDSIGTNSGVPGTQSSTYPTPSADVPPVSFPDTGSMSFNGQNYFTIDNPVSTDFTICAWIKTTSAGGGTDHWTSAPIMDAEVGGVAYDFGFGIGNGGKLMFGNGGVHPGDDPASTNAYWDDQVNGSTTVNDDAWHNVCVSRDGTTGQNILYVDANVDGSGTSGIGTQTQNLHARIGWGYDGAALYQGLIDDVRVYNGVLNQGQLANLTAGSNDPSAPPDDQDGIPASIEDAAPNSGDANADGTLDSQQANVASFVNSITGKYTTLQVDGACKITSSSVINGASIVADKGYTYPVGLMNFTVNCATPGFVSTVTQYYYGVPNGDYIVRKYDVTTHQYTTISSAQINRLVIGSQSVVKVSYQVTDGGPLDADGTANGIIVDPSGLATIGGPAAPNTGFITHNMTLAVLAFVAGASIIVLLIRRTYATTQK